MAKSHCSLRIGIGPICEEKMLLSFEKIAKQANKSEAKIAQTRGFLAERPLLSSYSTFFAILFAGGVPGLPRGGRAP